MRNNRAACAWRLLVRRRIELVIDVLRAHDTRRRRAQLLLLALVVILKSRVGKALLMRTISVAIAAVICWSVRAGGAWDGAPGVSMSARTGWRVGSGWADTPACRS
jgi:hypothetical protein